MKALGIRVARLFVGSSPQLAWAVVPVVHGASPGPGRQQVDTGPFMSKLLRTHAQIRIQFHLAACKQGSVISQRHTSVPLNTRLCEDHRPCRPCDIAISAGCCLLVLHATGGNLSWRCAAAWINSVCPA